LTKDLNVPTSSDTAKEAIRVLCYIETSFPDGSKKTGSGFFTPKPGILLTSAHVVREAGINASAIKVNKYDAVIKSVHEDIDIAVLSTTQKETALFGSTQSLQLGDQLMFGGFPIGVSGPSLFSGILSSQGTNLIRYPKCRLLQINGMINSGNSGGPVFKAGSLEVIGIVTAKYVPLLLEIDKLREILRNIPQFTSEVGIGKIDFSKFVNLMIQALLSVSGSLRLVQVGIGYAVPIDLFDTKLL
jgi:S1-C subfamily serine protease